MFELLNRIWQTVTALLKANIDYLGAMQDMDTRIHSRLLTIDSRLDSIQSTLSITDATLDGMVDTLDDLRVLITQILAAVSPLPAASLPFVFDLEGEISTGDYMKITITQKFAAAIAPVDKLSNPALVDGKPVWQAADPTIVSLVPSFDGLSVEVKALGKVGTSQVSCTADADLGTGVKTLTAAFTVDVVAGMAVGLGVVIGEAVEQDVVTTA